MLEETKDIKNSYHLKIRGAGSDPYSPCGGYKTDFPCVLILWEVWQGVKFLSHDSIRLGVVNFTKLGPNFVKLKLKFCF